MIAQKSVYLVYIDLMEKFVNNRRSKDTSTVALEFMHWAYVDIQYVYMKIYISGII